MPPRNPAATVAFSPFSPSPGPRNARRSLTDIEDQYATSTIHKGDWGPLPKVRRGISGRCISDMRRMGARSKGGIYSRRDDYEDEDKGKGWDGEENIFAQQSCKGEEGQGAGQGDGGYQTVFELDAAGFRAVDAPTSPEGRLRDRERENALSAQQVAEFQSMEHANSSEEVDDIATEAQNNEQTESQVFSAQPTVDPTTSASSPSSLAAPSPFNQPPLDLFRKPPRKVLSVSDLVATSWCELQYWYTLTKHGRKPPTQAMKLGTKAHKTLEDQVHTTVPIDIMTREDGWALRIWNLIQGLRTLRATGMTREFEVWGVVDGELVTGIIDQIATECPNQELEKKEAENYSQISTKEAKVSAQQMSLNDFLQKEAGGKTLNVFEAMMAGSKDTQPEQPEQADPGEEKPKKRGRKKKELRYYITDVKTRGGKSPSVPTLSSSGFVPTSLQLQLYYHLLTRLVTTDETTIEQIVERNRLDLDAPFSDTFLAQIGNLDQPEFDIPTRKRKSKSKKSKPPESDEDTDAVLGSEDALDT
ncbi:hypothetical protein KEM55_006357, partial [Ascosphaera atra]